MSGIRRDRRVQPAARRSIR